MFSYPHTIANGLGESLTFLRRVSTPQGEALEIENCVRPGSGPPMHVHHYQEEALTVVSGSMAYQRKGEAPRFAGPGETAVFYPGEMHRFWNAGEDELRCTGYVRPPDSLEYFLRGIYEAQKQSGGHRPEAFDAAYLMRRYRSEIAMDEIPAFVERFILPVQVVVGHVIGRYRKFADAPTPVRQDHRRIPRDQRGPSPTIQADRV